MEGGEWTALRSARLYPEWGVGGLQSSMYRGSYASRFSFNPLGAANEVYRFEAGSSSLSLCVEPLMKRAWPPVSSHVKVTICRFLLAEF